MEFADVKEENDDTIETEGQGREHPETCIKGNSATSSSQISESTPSSIVTCSNRWPASKDDFGMIGEEEGAEFLCIQNRDALNIKEESEEIELSPESDKKANLVTHKQKKPEGRRNICDHCDYKATIKG